MPSAQPPAKVLVTGANGFLALHIVKQLLEQNYIVRGTVRSAAKGEWIRSKFSEFGASFDFVVVQDITKEGAFDRAIEGVDAVIHTASPVPDNFLGTYDNVYIPAVRSAESIFKSLLNSPTVKRVVFTSSIVAMSMAGAHERGYTYSESDWNDGASSWVKEAPHDKPHPRFYFAAKTDAEHTAWNFYEQHKAEMKWDLVTLTPPYIFGPILQDEPNFSANLVYRKALEQKPADQVGLHAGFWIDVRDCARGHVLSLQKEEAGAERIFITGGALTWQEVYDELQSLNIPEIPKERVDDGDVKDVANTSKATGILGLTYRTLGESVRDTITVLRQRENQK
ncbi:D-lactaldehyde dehydrogenase [Calocera viscosa TUFC12733]|uniref:D-lactaldehyde dehydrogenase n=1 Tax=Calocera viscosa (strain TUFC12733) TaxID=1330018 RepID=A0A167K8Y9_CALVF|nr:D-lactaldehyde dehydrogenase [Calocera viscosa TUFC12733]